MKTPIRLLAAAVTSIALLTPSIANEEKADDFRAHEWGTFTTLHWPDSRQLIWYQPPSLKLGVDDLPDFVHGNFALKAMTQAKARMETPVIYFYSDKKRKVDVSVEFKGGRITEFYPAPARNVFQWKGVELIPPSLDEAKAITKKLPIDPKRPDNHYYQARAVPEAAIVRIEQVVAEDKSQKPAETEKFLFYRGMGDFDAGLNYRLDLDGNLSIQSFNQQSSFDHVWVLKSSKESVRWEKIALFAPYNYAAKTDATVVALEQMADFGSREKSIEALEASMVTALIEEGLTDAEAAAMVATWDEQWYEEPGQRVFSIPPKKNIDAVLPLKITPTPAAVVRVFVHRAEILSPQTIADLEKAMAPGTETAVTKEILNEAQLGRFVQGGIRAVAESVGNRTTREYSARGMTALRKTSETAAR